jgi:hypothetical protein
MPEGECGTVAQLPVSPRLQRSQVPHQAILSSDCTLSLCAKGGSQSLSGLFGHADASLPPVSREKEELAAPSQALQP